MGSSSLEPSRIVWHGHGIHQCLSQIQKDLIILKLDFEKAFDKIEHETILQILRAKGFGQK
jgi:hypothetical protein